MRRKREKKCNGSLSGVVSDLSTLVGLYIIDSALGLNWADLHTE
jgi:hypothetical protein